MVQAIGRCHVPLLKNAKTFAFWRNVTKGITVQSLVAKLITDHFGINEILKLKESIIKNSNNSELIERDK